MNLTKEANFLDLEKYFPDPEIIGVSPTLIPACRPLIYWPDKILATPCNPVIEFDIVLQQLVLDMAFTMARTNGIGIAAPQVGELLDVIIVEEQLDFSNPVVLINPTVIEVDPIYKFSTMEGCLSVPGHYEKRKRPNYVIVEYQNTTGQTNIKNFTGLAAFVVQHEMEHLVGKIFVDDLSSLKKDRIKKKIKKKSKV